MTTMQFNPPLRRKGVEVTSINEELHTIHFVVHAKARVEDVTTMEFTAHVSARIKDTVHYLEMEGYIGPKQNWLTHMGVILHPPEDGDNIYQTA